MLSPGQIVSSIVPHFLFQLVVQIQNPGPTTVISMTSHYRRHVTETCGLNGHVHAYSCNQPPSRMVPPAKGWKFKHSKRNPCRRDVTAFVQQVLHSGGMCPELTDRDSRRGIDKTVDDAGCTDMISFNCYSWNSSSVVSIPTRRFSDGE
jgi:hypothetical protein